MIKEIEELNEKIENAQEDCGNLDWISKEKALKIIAEVFDEKELNIIKIKDDTAQVVKELAELINVSEDTIIYVAVNQKLTEQRSLIDYRNRQKNTENKENDK